MLSGAGNLISGPTSVRGLICIKKNYVKVKSSHFQSVVKQAPTAYRAWLRLLLLQKNALQTLIS